MQPLRPYEKLDTLRQFLDCDRHVLQFYCHWDDTDSMFGDHRWMELHYFLADDTIEILEKIPPNSGRDAVPVFLRRARLPKVEGKQTCTAIATVVLGTCTGPHQSCGAVCLPPGAQAPDAARGRHQEDCPQRVWDRPRRKVHS